MGERFSDCAMAGAGGAGSIFQDAQHEAGENSGVGPLPADINIVAPPSPETQHTLQSTVSVTVW